MRDSNNAEGVLAAEGPCSSQREHLQTERLADAIFAQIADEQQAGRTHDPHSNGADRRPQVSEAQLISLWSLFDKNFAKALEIVDKGGVQCLVGKESRRRVFQVQGKAAADRYLVFPEHFCTCHAFFYEVVSKSEATHCKHMLAARVADALGLCSLTEAPDEDVSRLMLSYAATR